MSTNHFIYNPFTQNFDAVGTGGGAASITITGDSGGPQTDSAFTIVGGGAGISFDWDGVKFVINQSGSGFTWNTITSTPQVLAGENGYIIEDNGPPAITVLQLPATPVVGTTVKIFNFNADGWQINQRAGEQIFIGDISTFAGLTHGISAANIGTSITLVCVSTTGGNFWAADGSPQGIIGFF